MKATTLLLILGLLSVYAQRKFIEFDRTLSVSQGWRQIGEPSSSKQLRLTFALNIRNAGELEQLFWAISDPKSPQYTNYLSYDEICSKFSAHEDDINTLKNWLTSYGLTTFSIPKTGDFLHVTADVLTVEQMLQVKLYSFEHDEHPTIIRSLDPYSLPNEVAHTVAFVTGINRFPSNNLLKLRRSNNLTPQQSITPQVIWQTFKTNGQSGSAPSNIQAVAQFLGQYYAPSDLSTFQQNFNLPVQPVNKLIGPNQPNNPGTEASLDIEYIMGVAPKVPTWFWSTGGLHEGQEPFVQWATDMNNQPDGQIPFVVSVSYGDEESSISKPYADSLNIQLQKLATRGVSVLFASGDDGVGCTQNCVNDPNWPASSPYVTTVGGFVGPSPLVGDSISSGGFSNYYSTPSYQSQVVQNYLKNGPNIPPATQFNATGRAMPDVSSFSENVVVVQYGGQIGVGGTSCASPVFAAIISLVNDNLLQQGKKSLGFLNTALYQLGQNDPTVFLDVTQGINSNGCCSGFVATKGWDPITGWGGPNYPNLLKAFASLQDK